MAARRTRRLRASLRRREPHPARPAAERALPRLVQPTGARRSAGTRLRQSDGCRSTPSARLGVPRDADAYLCGPTEFMQDLTTALVAYGIDRARIRTEIFGAGPTMTPGVVATTARAPHLPDGAPGTGPSVVVRAQRPHRAMGSPLRQPARARRSLQRARPGGRVAPASATTARAVCCREPSPIRRIRWSRPPTATCSSAAPSRATTSYSTCDVLGRLRGQTPRSLVVPGRRPAKNRVDSGDLGLRLSASSLLPRLPRSLRLYRCAAPQVRASPLHESRVPRPRRHAGGWRDPVGQASRRPFRCRMCAGPQRGNRPRPERDRLRERASGQPGERVGRHRRRRPEHPGLRHRHQRQPRRDGRVQGRHQRAPTTASTSTASATTAGSARARSRRSSRRRRCRRTSPPA